MENEVLKTLKSRFSARRYLNTPVEKEKLGAILEAATYTASGHNRQGWHFTVVASDEGKKELLSAVGPEPEMFKKLAPKGATWPFPNDFFGATVVIMVSYDPTAPWADCGAYMAAGNIMTAAASLGLATCALTVFSQDVFKTEETAKLKAKFIPEGYQLYLSLVLGYPEKVPVKPLPRREDVVSWL